MLFVVRMKNAVFFSKVGAEESSESDQECAYTSGSFCDDLNSAYKSNLKALKFFNKHPNRLDENFIKNGTTRIHQANKSIRDIMEKRTQQEVLAGLKKALGRERGALTWAKLTCLTDTRRGDIEREESCTFVYSKIGAGIQELVEAIKEVVTDPEMRGKLLEAYEDFYGQFDSPNPIEALALGQKILDAMKQNS
ncbi:hypothetical protein Q1695_004148 [Nippostrongylus brasiliensis]|nr:hypothetical protein Q1695_004148 [Nippostrongylus brasiliensis]